MQRKPQNPLFSAILASLILAFIGALVFGSLTSQYRIPSQGTIAGVSLGIYEDENCTIPVTVIDWGTVYNTAGNISKAVYLRNEGNVNVHLVMNVSDWNPINASLWLNLTWNYVNQTLTPNEAIAVNFVLHVDPMISIDSFSMDIWIIAVDPPRDITISDNGNGVDAV